MMNNNDQLSVIMKTAMKVKNMLPTGRIETMLITLVNDDIKCEEQHKYYADDCWVNLHSEGNFVIHKYDENRRDCNSDAEEEHRFYHPIPLLYYVA